MLTYFWGMGTYFYWGDGSIYLLGGWVEIFGGGGGMNTPIPPGFAPLTYYSEKIKKTTLETFNDISQLTVRLSICS